MLADFFIIFYWWLLLLFLGLLFLPLAFSLFKSFWDRGWIFAKTIAILIFSYLIFLLGTLHILPFFKETAVLVLLVFIALFVRWFSVKENRKNFFEEFKNNWKVFLLEEVIFFSALLFWSFIRGFQPDIEGLEKFMDGGFVNSILRSGWFPPRDMWFAGESINYYYFGHLQAAVLTLLSGLDSSVTYNLMIATVFAFTFSATFSLTSNLVFSSAELRPKLKNLILAGLISAFLIALGGNLHSAVYGLKNSKGSYWYPDATRFIGHNPNNPNDKTIHEFPIYSFVVADLHGHMNNIPTVLLFLAILLVYAKKLWQMEKGKKDLWVLKKELAALAFLLGVMYMTNSWDFPIYGVIFGLTTLMIIARKSFGQKSSLTPAPESPTFQRGDEWQSIWGFRRGVSSPGKGKPRASARGGFTLLNQWLVILAKVFANGLTVLFLSVLVALPFALTFNPMTDGIARVNAHSLFWQLLVLWGFFWFIAFGFVVFALFRLFKSRLELEPADWLILVSVLWATVLIIIPEIIYVKDIYIAEYHRANTMFKLVYQSFMIYSISAGYVFFRIKNSISKRTPLLWFGYFLLFLIGFLAHMVYPYFAIRGYYGSLKEYKGLAGLGFMERLYPDNYKALLWIKKNISGQPVMLEAVGDSYTLYNQISAFSGLPTIEGWLVHEWLWRGGYDLPGARATEVETIYQGEDEAAAERLLKDYGVEYVFVGSLEKEKYPDLKTERFDLLGKVVFVSGETKIYHLDRLD
ncbi:MAG: DUF2298 domain-containing protein [Patescibacteria group bacterium]|nr:hypothetical protein [Patescibacteria group bacterium]